MNEARLSDEQWEVIEPLLPPQPRTGRRRQHDREVLNSLVYRRLGQNGRYRACPLVTGSRYRDLPRTPEYAASASVVVNAGRRGRTPSSTQSARSAGWWSGSTPGMTTTEDSLFDMTAKPLTAAPMLSSPLSSCVLDVCLPLLNYAFLDWFKTEAMSARQKSAAQAGGCGKAGVQLVPRADLGLAKLDFARFCRVSLRGSREVAAVPAFSPGRAPRQTW